MSKHEVWLELTSGTRVLAGTDLPDVPTANALATYWKNLAETRPDELHETMPGSGTVVRGSAIIVIKAQGVPKGGPMGGVIKVPREGIWL